MVKCPACGSTSVSWINDYEHSVCILRCNMCGDSYAASRYDIARLGERVVLEEWHKSYWHQRKLETVEERPCNSMDRVQTS